jgi:succinoglycan biosynthesis transport protein ExoP
MEGHLKSLERRAAIQALKGKPGAEVAAGLPGAMKDELTAKLREELAALEAEYSQTQGVYAPNSPKMRMMQKREAFLRSRIAELENKMVNTALDTAKSREELLKQSYDRAKAEADRVKSLEAQYSLLKTAADTASEFHKILLREYKETEIRARTTSNNVRIVDSPSRPTAPSKPKKRLIILLGALAGLAGGILAAFVIDALDQTVRDPREIEELFEAKHLGIIPDIRRLKPTRSTGANKERYELLACKYPQSPVSDAMKNIQASIFLSSLDDHVSSLAVSSATPGEGKTFLSVSLATVLASVSGKRVVLVDGDMRRPRLHSAFSLSDGDVGLSDFLGSPSLRLSKVMRRTGIGGLYVMTAGSPPSDPVTLLQAEDLKALVGQLTANFDYVIVDTPPVLGFADTPLICRSVDGLVLVVKHGSVRRGEVSVAIDIVQSVGCARMVGMVLNQVSIGGIGSYGYGYGAYYYRNYKYYRERQA